MSFKDKVVIVTGASSGIGAAVAKEFAAEGALVAIVGRNEAKLATTAADCPNALVIRADVTNDEEARGIIDKTVEKFGQIDVLVNNAGSGLHYDIFDENIMKAYDFTMNVNLRAVFRVTSLAIPYLIKTKGNIINMSSISGECTRLSSMAITYSVSKAALTHFSAFIATDLAPHGVRVNAIIAGPVVTDLLENTGFPASWDVFKGTTALGKLSDPQEIANLVLFLASDKAKSVTGSNYLCDNGFMIKRL